MKTKIKEQKMYYDVSTKFALEQAIDINYPVLMVGETGTGKSSFLRDIANKRGIELIRLNLTGQTGVDEILGKYLVKGNENGTNEMYWIDGLLIEAMKKGYFIVFDEINAALPEVLFALHSLLDDDRKIVLKEKDGSIIRPHERFRFFATMNPSDEYVGTKELNKAFLSRFPIVLNINYSEKEADIIFKRTGMLKSDAEKMVLAARQIREYKEKEELTYPCSTRDLLYCAELIVNKFKVEKALELAILNKVDIEEREKVKTIFQLVTGENIKIETNNGIKFFKTIEDIKKIINENDKKEEEMKNEKHKMENNFNEVKKEIIEFKNNAKKENDELKEKIIDLEVEKKENEIIKKKIIELLKQCKVSQKDINKLFREKKM